MQATITPGRRTYRAGRVAAFAFGAVANAALWITIFGVLIASVGSEGSTSGYLIAGAVCGVVAASSFWIAVRIARSGLWLSSSGAVIRGPIRTWTVALSDIAGFEPGIQPGAGNGTPTPRLRKVGGERIAIWALGREGLVARYDRYMDELQPVCDALNGTLMTLRDPDRAGRG